MYDKTMTFSLERDREPDIKKVLTMVYDALKEKGYNPINQLVGYILSEDPTYLSLIHISEPTRQESRSRMPASA